MTIVCIPISLSHGVRSILRWKEDIDERRDDSLFHVFIPTLFLVSSFTRTLGKWRYFTIVRWHALITSLPKNIFIDRTCTLGKSYNIAMKMKEFQYKNNAISVQSIFIVFFFLLSLRLFIYLSFFLFGIYIYSFTSQ